MQAGFIAAIPALAGFAGGIPGGFISDFLLRKAVSLTAARKIPSVAGMILDADHALPLHGQHTPDRGAHDTGVLRQGRCRTGLGLRHRHAPKEANSVSAAIMPPSRPPSLPRFRRP